MSKATMTKERVLPNKILSDVIWSFIGGRFVDQSKFDQQVRQEQIDIGGKDTWRPRQIVIPCCRLRVSYVFWQDCKQIEPVVELRCDNGKFFTAGELLFKLHNVLVEKLQDTDHHFFQGLILKQKMVGDFPPLYQVSQGS